MTLTPYRAVVDDLNPAQQEVLDNLGASRGERPEFEVTLRHELRSALEEGLEPVLDGIAADDTLFVSKHLLGRVLGCERRFVAELDDDFEWTVPIARGSVAHKAVEMSVHWRREPEPLALVDEALARLADGSDGLGDFLRTVTEVERAELRAEANERVTKFMECFPPLKPAWRPVTESRMRIELHDARIVLSGKVDLSLGQPDGRRAGKVLIDLKTGAFSPVHLEDLRFYALLECMRVGTPPRRIASYYLDQGRFVPEDVTEDMLFGAVSRVIDGAHRIVGLKGAVREPTVAPGPACRWCQVRPDCPEGRRYLEDTDDEAGW